MGIILKKQEILFQNYGDSVEFEAEYLNQISDEKIIIRMLRNLKNSCTDSFAFDKAVFCNQMILEMLPESPDETRDMGILENKLDNYKNAIIFLNRYLLIIFHIIWNINLLILFD